MQLHKGRKGSLPQPVKLPSEQINLLGVLFGCIHEALACPNLFEAGLSCADGTFVLLDTAASAHDSWLLSFLWSSATSTALVGTKAPDVFSLDHVLLQLPEFFLEHVVLHLA